MKARFFAATTLMPGWLAARLRPRVSSPDARTPAHNKGLFSLLLTFVVLVVAAIALIALVFEVGTAAVDRAFADLTAMNEADEEIDTLVGLTSQLQVSGHFFRATARAKPAGLAQRTRGRPIAVGRIAGA